MDQYRIFSALQTGLEQAGSVQSPGETHGTLTGMLCIDRELPPTEAVDDVTSSEMLTTALDALRDITLDGLLDPELSFTPLLPSDDEPLEVRVASLARWCGGFLYGLSCQGSFSPDRLSGEVREVVSDLTEIARVEVGPDNDDEDSSEADYMELVEYVRVGVQMIFLELQPKREGPQTRETLH